MQDKITEIQKLARELEELDNNNDHLFKSINELDKKTIDKLHQEYEAVKNNFKPVNLLRYMVLERLKNGEEIDEKVVESLKDKIRNKETEHFTHLGNELIEGLKN